MQAACRSERSHWRADALRRFPDYEEFISATDEEYAIYNLFFQLLEEFEDAVTRRHTDRASKIIAFGASCLRGELASDGEDIAVAAGVSLFEHLFDDVAQTRWEAVFSCIPRDTYDACRQYLQHWMDPAEFAKVDAYARTKYAYPSAGACVSLD
jgi:hypothetical protein